MPSGWDWAALAVAFVALGVQQFVTHKRWKALIQAIREKRKNGNGGPPAPPRG